MRSLSACLSAFCRSRKEKTSIDETLRAGGGKEETREHQIRKRGVRINLLLTLVQKRATAIHHWKADRRYLSRLRPGNSEVVERRLRHIDATRPFVGGDDFGRSHATCTARRRSPFFLNAKRLLC
ncbi:unnamed protein product [Caenorhabditis auriculariae]|uniref:Uncharacterized protein n=1 Tax=Caenorhabditis auriculariae TaxID=2777116 RepID=A0A8S1HEC4_9PELO|nr:unnamed protein product [Caenorhabditis auriculariae]